MRKRLFSFVLILALLSIPCGAFAGKWTDWWKPGEWFGKKQRSTTVTGTVANVAEGKVMFETLDGQSLQLIGDKAAKVGENRAVKIRVFGNVFKPDQKYPSGAIQVRNFKVLEEAVVPANEIPVGDEETIVSTPEPYVEPEPYLEPEPVVEPEPIVEPEPYVEEPSPMAVPVEEMVTDDTSMFNHDDEEEPQAEPAFDEYVVVSGDTLGKISKKVFGTTAKWKKIAEANGITNPKLLKVGMTLRIPKDL
jgi:hypothetical protein